MSRPSSRCCRSAHHHVRVRNDTIWVHESALAKAFERYMSIVTVNLRHASSVPGPLENRRRLGKRHMGELSFGQSHSSAQPWDLYNAADLTQWRWSPPTTAEFRQNKLSARASGSLWGTVIDWLDSKDPSLSRQSGRLATQSLESRADTNEYVPAEPLGAVQEQLLGSNTTSPPETQVTLEKSIHDIVNQGLNLVSRYGVLDIQADLRPKFSAFCSSLAEAIAQGKVTGEDICTVVNGISANLCHALSQLPPIEATKIAGALRLELCEAVLNGVARAALKPELELRVWTVLLKEISDLWLNNLRVFTRIMDVVPTSYLPLMEDGIVANIDSFFNECGRSARKHSSLVRQINKIATPLRNLDFELHRDIFDASLKRLSTYVSEKDLSFSKMRFCWLQVLARLQTVERQYLVETCLELENVGDAARLSSKRVCQLFLAHLNARGVLAESSKIHTELDKIKAGGNCYAEISAALWRSRQPQHIREFCDFLYRLQRPNAVIKAVKGITHMLHNDPAPLVNLAIAVGHPSLALKFIDLFGLNRRGGRQSFWESAFADDALKDLVMLSSIRPSKLLDTLGISRQRSECLSTAEVRLIRKQRKAGRGRSIDIRKVRIVAKVATAIARAPHISDRTALDLLTRCVKYLQLRHAELPREVLHALYQIITRDLVKGQQGRTTRLQWFLSLLRKQASDRKVMVVGSNLEQWRESLKRYHRKRQQMGY